MSPAYFRELTRSERASIRKLVTKFCANYDDREKICAPLDCPCYMLQKWWTGSLCCYFAKAVLPIDVSLEARLSGNDTSQRQKQCPVCGRIYLPTTSQAYCSESCRSWARREADKMRKRRIRQKNS